MAKNMKKPKDIRDMHTFVVCVYGESPYLEECIESLLRQKLQSQICLSAAQETDYLIKIANQYQLPFYTRHSAANLAEDWNYALSVANTELVTLAHQDDVYLPDYSRGIYEGYQMSRRAGQDPIILFTDYMELRNGEVSSDSALLKVKHLMLSPLKNPSAWNSRFVRRRILSAGSAICCPSVTLCRQHIPDRLFKDNLQSNIDWQAWEELSRLKGAFVYWAKPLMYHRIHPASTTNRLLMNEQRKFEDLYMFRKFWPEGVAQMFAAAYQLNERSAKA